MPEAASELQTNERAHQAIVGQIVDVRLTRNVERQESLRLGRRWIRCDRRSHTDHRVRTDVAERELPVLFTGVKVGADDGVSGHGSWRSEVRESRAPREILVLRREHHFEGIVQTKWE